MLPVIIANYNRKNLLKQTLNSLLRNSAGEIKIAVVDDGSTDGSRKYLKRLQGQGIIEYATTEQRSGPWLCRNIGSTFFSGSGQKFIYFSDNDVYFEKNWDKAMLDTLKSHPEIGILGGVRHPHHSVSSSIHGIEYSDQQAGYSLLMKWSVWTKIGPFIRTEPGVYGKEDVELCERCKALGYKIASVLPPVIAHCGITNSDGKLSPAIAEMQQRKIDRKDLIFE